MSLHQLAMSKKTGECSSSSSSPSKTSRSPSKAKSASKAKAAVHQSGTAASSSPDIRLLYCRLHVRNPFVTHDKRFLERGFATGDVPEEFDAIVYDGSHDADQDSRCGVYVLRDAKTQAVPMYGIALTASPSTSADK